MPLFLAISGFLIEEGNFLKTKLSLLIKKYTKRLIIPWFFASIFFFLFNNYKLIITSNSIFEIAFLFLVSLLFFPFHNLWFIPALFLFTIFTWILKKKNISDIIILISSLFFVRLIFILLSLSSNPHISFIYLIIREYRPQFYFFFFLGYYIRNREIHYRNYSLLRFFVIFLFFLRGTSYFPAIKIAFLYDIPVFYLLNVFLILFSLNYLIKFDFKKFSSIKWSGSNSLPIYLYHPISYTIFFAYNSPLFIPNTILLFFFNLLIILVEIIIFYLLNRKSNKSINIIFFGRWKS